MNTLCAACTEVRDNAPLFLPTELVHPEHGAAGVWSIYSEAVCTERRAVWPTKRDNIAEIPVR